MIESPPQRKDTIPYQIDVPASAVVKDVQRKIRYLAQFVTDDAMPPPESLATISINTLKRRVQAALSQQKPITVDLLTGKDVELMRLTAIEELKQYGIDYSLLKRGLTKQASPEELLARCRIIVEKGCAVTHKLLYLSQEKLNIELARRAQESTLTAEGEAQSKQELDVLLKSRGMYSVPPYVRNSAQYILDAIRDIEKAGVIFTDKMWRFVRYGEDKRKQEIEKMLALRKPEIRIPQPPDSLIDGAHLYINCLPHQSNQFAHLHGREVMVLFKSNPSFDYAVMSRYEKDNDTRFRSEYSLMVVEVGKMDATPFVIPRNLLMKNAPNSQSEICSAAKKVCERPTDSIKYITGGAKQMAPEKEHTRAIRRQRPRAIILSPEDDRYATALHFVRYHYRENNVGSQRSHELSNVVCLLPDFQDNGMPVVWIVDSNIFLSNERAPLPSEDVDPQPITPAPDSLHVECRLPLVHRRMIFSRELPASIKKIFPVDSLWVDGVIVTMDEIPEEVPLNDEDIALLSRGTSVGVVFYIPQLSRYICIERRFLSMIPN